jgi:hypothetical protein
MVALRPRTEERGGRVATLVVLPPLRVAAQPQFFFLIFNFYKKEVSSTLIFVFSK